MQGQINPKVVGATIIGFALVGGAYISSNFGKHESTTLPAAVSASTPPRAAITVTDSDSNGIEDWRDEFVTTEPITLNIATTSYVLPDTLTGKVSVNFLEDIIRSKNYGPFGKTDTEVIQNTVNNLARETEIRIFDTPDVNIMVDWDDEDVLNYANTVAAIIYNNSIPEIDGELEILYDVVTNNKPERLSELETLAGVYANYRDDTLKIPVPNLLAKEHLDLINTYNAIHEDIKAMTLAFDDPAVALLRLKRYQDDATGLAQALQNMYVGLEPYADKVSADDPASLFVLFSPAIRI